MRQPDNAGPEIALVLHQLIKRLVNIVTGIVQPIRIYGDSEHMPVDSALSAPGPVSPRVIVIDELSIDLRNKAVFENMVEVRVSEVEFLMLEAFVKEPDKIFMAEELSRILDSQNYSPSNINLRTVIHRLRKHRSSIGRRLKSIRGFGYYLEGQLT